MILDIDFLSPFVTERKNIPLYGVQENIQLNDDVIAISGFINSHEHLEFNLFEKYGNPPYKDYIEWSNDIHKKYKPEIEKILKIPSNVRQKWGVLKNIINGFTSVIDHGNLPLYDTNNSIDIIKSFITIHSVGLDKGWWIKSNLFHRQIKMIHLGEGTNDKIRAEAKKFFSTIFFRSNIIGIHGISLTIEQVKKLKALVWCPDSNFFLYNRTADIRLFKKNTKILFGSDSALSSDWNIWNHLKGAIKTKELTENELLKSLTITPSNLFDIDNNSDFLILNKRVANEKLFKEININNIALVIKNNRIIYADKKFLEKNNLMNHISHFELYPFNFNNNEKLCVIDVRQLITETKKYVPEFSFPFTN